MTANAQPKGSSLKRWLYRGALVCLALMYFSWVRSPASSWVDDRLAEMNQEVEARFAGRQEHADDEVQNGFLNPTLRGYWGRVGFERQAGSEAERVVESFRDRFSSIANGRIIEHGPLQDDDIRAFRAQFEALLPELKVALAAPDFVIPEKEINEDSPGANLDAFRSLALALSGHCEQLMAEGKPEEALESLGLLLKLGDRLVDQEANLPTMTGGSVLSIGLQTINGVFGPEANLTPAQRRELYTLLLAHRPPEDEPGRHCLEREFYLIQKSLDTEESRKLVPPAVRYVPGLFYREKQITRKVMSNLHGQLGLKYAYAVDFSWDGYLVGDIGFHSSKWAQDWYRVPLELNRLNTRMLGYSLCC
ncbi:MAG: hypothetical protein KC800_18930, partial [Candidatus Eremiobacteraeota bacterium]|nr:hypothetical protein [Candidatus Eremiobacteraeota bacterium]